MNKKEANQITGGLSKPSKMPGYAYNIPATRCKVGAKLVKVPGSVCHGCYALKGRYRFRNVKEALERRYQAAMNNPNWIHGMVYLIQVSKKKEFPSHDHQGSIVERITASRVGSQCLTSGVSSQTWKIRSKCSRDWMSPESCQRNSFFFETCIK